MLELGHVDFYPGSDLEFGWNQPGCWQVADIGSCSHSRSHDLFISSLEAPCPALQVCVNTTLIPNSCNNLTAVLPTMGYYVDREKFDGRAFTVLTDAKLPFCVTEEYNNLL
ncbi:lipase member H-A [Eurytemora carolleeae]|uniref:lipase member H-A n=1 Tax=Eurytemora carolleeae TaxID=1294199 RepID=UPI000C76DB14|nr:lipase member H-A [Eurytemora carolleeae]|eukprot:XP_023339735.1 lipase member H-A-like [Eurytemora affinis]